jgi:AcrR family transcriptional regulator
VLKEQKRPKPTSAKSQYWRPLILDKAASLFNDVGYQATTMDDLADAVGLAKPSLYYYFRSKEEILFEISNSMINSLVSSLEARANAGLTPSQLILEAMADVIEATVSDPGRMRVLVEHDADLSPDQMAVISEHRQRYQSLLEGILTEAIAAGEMRPVDVSLAARAVFGMCNWTYRWFGPDTPYKPREIVYAFWDIVNKGISADRSGG